MRNGKLTRAAIATAAITLGLTLAGCTGQGTDNFKDLEGITAQDPDRVEVYNNVDGHPNIALLCIHGTAVLTTTRTDADAVNLAPELNAYCGGAQAPARSPALGPSK